MYRRYMPGIAERQTSASPRVLWDFSTDTTIWQAAAPNLPACCIFPLSSWSMPGRPLTPSQQSSMVSNISVPISKSQELYSTSSVPNRITPTCNKPAGMPASKPWDICPNAKASKYPPGHLGLNIDSEFCFDEFADRIACQVEQTVDIDRLLDICSCATAPSSCLPGETNSHTSDMRIAIACDEAFNFIYPENLRVLEQKGKLTFFSPLYDSELPISDLVYLPGGYPEFYLSRLSENRTMRAVDTELLPKRRTSVCRMRGNDVSRRIYYRYRRTFLSDVRFFTARSNDGKYEIKTRISQNFSERAGIPGPRIPLLPHYPGPKPPAIHCPGNECQRDGSRYAGLSFRACHCQLYSLLLGRSSPFFI